MIREGHPLALVGFPSSSVRKNDRNRIFKSGRQHKESTNTRIGTAME